MGLPEIFITFQTAAVSAITRSARGVLAVALSDSTQGGAAEAVYQSLAEVPKDKFTAANYRLLKLAFLAAPSKVRVLRVGADDSAVYEALQRLQFDWLAAPGLDSGEVISFIKSQRAGGRGVKAVVANASGPDCEGIVNLCASDLVLEDGAIQAKDYAVRVAGLLAALPLTRSATYASLSEVVSCGTSDDPDKDVDDGKLILVSGRDGYRLGRAVNSLITLTVDKAAPFQKIKIIEGIDLIRTDIARGQGSQRLRQQAAAGHRHQRLSQGVGGRRAGQNRRQPLLRLPVRPEELSGEQGHRHFRHEGRGHPARQHRQRGLSGGEPHLLRRHGGPGAEDFYVRRRNYG